MAWSAGRCADGAFEQAQQMLRNFIGCMRAGARQRTGSQGRESRRVAEELAHHGVESLGAQFALRQMDRGPCTLERQGIGRLVIVGGRGKGADYRWEAPGAKL